MPSVFATERFRRWLSELRDKRAKHLIQARIDWLEDGHFGDCKPVGEKVFEMRIHFGPGYRLYFTMHGLELIFLLAGGDKSTQRADIEMAISEARSLKE